MVLLVLSPNNHSKLSPLIKFLIKAGANLTNTFVGPYTQGPNSSKHPLSLLMQKDGQQFRKLIQLKASQSVLKIGFESLQAGGLQTTVNYEEHSLTNLSSRWYGLFCRNRNLLIQQCPTLGHSHTLLWTSFRQWSEKK